MIATLQSLRFVFILMIFATHITFSYGHPVDSLGDCGVAFFFILSGFVMSFAYNRQLSDGTFSYKTYILKRIRKIYPLHLALLLFFVVATSAVFEADKFAANALLLQSWIPIDSYYFSYNGVSWFLSSLMFCYAVFPFAHRYMSPLFTTLVFSLYAVATFIIPYSDVNTFLYIHPLSRFVDFYIGMLLCSYYRTHSSQSVPAVFEWLLVVALAALLWAYPYADAKFRTAPMFWIILVPLIYVFARGRGHLSLLLKTRSMQWLGSISMPFYLMHYVIITAFLKVLPDMPEYLAVVIALPTTIIASFIVNKYFLPLFRN